MRIAHVVTYVSGDGAFGGPSRVALGQAEALAAQGHDVTVYAAAPPGEAETVRRGGFVLRTFPGRRVYPGSGFALMRSHDLTRALRRDIGEMDVAHVHFARDLVTIPSTRVIRSAGVPYVLQTHGMVDTSERLLARPLDAIATRSYLRGAGAVLVLTEREAAAITAVEPQASTRMIANGVKVDALPSYDERDDVVLFLARLHSRKRPMAFVAMAEALAPNHPEMKFIIAGPDEGEGASVARAIANSRFSSQIEWRGPVPPDDTEAVMSAARVYVLPSMGEVFPMSVLEAFRTGTPVVTTDSLGIARACKRYGAADVTDGSPENLAEAVEKILSDRRVAERLRRGGHDFLRAELDIRSVALELQQIYESLRCERSEGG